MAHTQVVLKHDVENLGTSGEVIRVRSGFARNYLVPRGLAVMATRANVKKVEHEKQMALQRLEKEREEASKRAEQLKSLSIHVAKQAGEEGKLYGSVTSTDIIDALKRKGVDIDKKKIIMPEEAIKEVGSYTFEVNLGAGVTVPVKLEVKTAA